MKATKIIASAIVIIFIMSFLGYAQDKEETPYWYLSYAKVSFATADSLGKFFKDDFAPIVNEGKKQGTILDYKLLFHHTGGEHTVILMTKFPSWAAIDEGWMTKALKVIEPDKEKREIFWDAFMYVLDGFVHYDEIYTEFDF